MMFGKEMKSRTTLANLRTLPRRHGAFLAAVFEEVLFYYEKKVAPWALLAPFLERGNRRQVEIDLLALSDRAEIPGQPLAPFVDPMRWKSQNPVPRGRKPDRALSELFSDSRLLRKASSRHP